jgi:dihydropteroate synthase
MGWNPWEGLTGEAAFPWPMSLGRRKAVWRFLPGLKHLGGSAIAPSDPHTRFNVRVVAGPGPGLPPDARRDCPLLLAVESIGTRTAGALRRSLVQYGGDAFFAGRRLRRNLFEPRSLTPDSLSTTTAPPPLFLSGSPDVFARLFLVSEPRSGLWQALSHSLLSYQQALEDPTPTRIMGILNVTPDSFSDGGLYLDPGLAEERAKQMVEEGAQILDIGGESTRPGSEAVPPEEELRRVLPVVQRLAGRVKAEISLDTSKAVVARACLDAGATIINDVSGLTFETKLAQAVAAAGATLILMHMLGTPRTMQQDPRYDDVVADTMRFLRRQLRVARDAGVGEDRLWIDPGFGFGKTAAHNLEILRRLREYTSVGAPILIGTSRKSTIGRVLSDLPSDQRLEGTAATVAVAIMYGASIVRVHDVKEMARVARMTDAVVGRRTTDTGG